MRLIRWIGFAVTVIVVLVFSLQNIGTPSLQSNLSLKFFGFQTPEWPVLLWLAISFFCGIFLYMLVSVVREIRMRAKIANLEHELEMYREEFQEEEGEEHENFEERNEVK